ERACSRQVARRGPQRSVRSLVAVAERGVFGESLRGRTCAIRTEQPAQILSFGEWRREARFGLGERGGEPTEALCVLRQGLPAGAALRGCLARPGRGRISEHRDRRNCQARRVDDLLATPFGEFGDRRRLGREIVVTPPNFGGLEGAARAHGRFL